MFKSVTRVVSRTSNVGHRHGYRPRMPTSRFSIKNRSISSSRLKSFPAEKIRRVERSPINKPPESTHVLNQQPIHSGEGDVPADSQNAQLLPSPTRNENLMTTSEQQVSQTVCPKDNRLNRSEVVIPTREIDKTPIGPPQLPPSIQQAPLQHLRRYQQQIPGQTFQEKMDNVTAVDNDCNQHVQSRNLLSSQQHDNRPRTEVISQIPQQSILHDAKLESKQQVDGNKKKSLKFTPAMMRDQELLVMTMRQQGINEDIMRRQFDALLAEQRKQLLYLEQLENPATSEMRKSSQAPRVKRRISKIEEDDGKPEWMLHITPPRIPYSVLEKMQADRLDDLSKTMRNDQKIEDMNPGHQSNIQKNQDMYNRSAHGCHQHLDPNVPQHQSQYSYIPNNINVPKHHQTCNVNGVPSGQYQQRYDPKGHDDRALFHQQQSYKPNNDQKILAKTWQVGENQNEIKQHDEHRKYNKNVEPSSLLKLRLYREVIKRQKQNNGLQDPETIKEAIEALNNPLNRKGLEYLENLNKKQQKPVLLNGVQDPNETPMTHQLLSHVCHQPTSRGPSANGLENSRNPNNPPPCIIPKIRRVDEFYMSEYPRQRTANNSRNCYNLMAERENGTVAMTKSHVQDSHGPSENQVPGLNNSQIKSDYPNYRQPGNTHQPTIQYNANKHSANYGNPTQFPLNPNERSRWCVDRMQGRHENTEKCHDHTTRKSDFFREEQSNSNQKQDLYNPHKNYGIYEPVMIGGLKYLARKPEYCQKQPSLQHYPSNLGRSFNPVIACQ